MASLPRASLHPPITTDPAHIAWIEQALADAAARRTRALALAPALAARAAPPDKVSISMVNVSATDGFDNYLFVRFKGGPLVKIMADSGNDCLVMPSLDALRALPNFHTDYTVLIDCNGGPCTQEPFGNDAALVRGPIEIPAADGSIVTLRDCVFFACKGSGPDDKGNFGLGVVTNVRQVGDNTVQPPLTYNIGYGYAEVDLVDVPMGLDDSGNPIISDKSLLTLYKQPPASYSPLFEIMPDVPWMALVPEALSINGTQTTWPKNLDQPIIAMIDTGGQLTFLRDPNGDLAKTQWPDGDVPSWATEPAEVCVATNSKIDITLGDSKGSYSYTIDPDELPPTDRRTTLVMCKEPTYMFGWNGMNIGGLSLVFNSLLIDYANKKVGLKKKAPADA
jgi:hypothetical protein